jgi:hypothetical protein
MQSCKNSVKAVVVLGLIGLLTLLIAGCGGGGGGNDPSPGKVTSYFHVQDQSGNPIVGLKVTYTDPSNVKNVSPSTDSSGNATITTTSVGTYTVNYADYGGNRYAISGTQFYNTQADLDANRTVSYRIIVNTSTGAISITKI